MNLQQYINKKYLGKGRCSKCYLLQNESVYKQFNTPLDVSEIDRFKYFLSYKNDNFLFPYEFICDDKKLYGYITKKASGKTLEDIFIDCDLNKFSSNSKKLEDNIKYISEGRIIMYDFHSENIMYDDSIFEVIDTDEYSISGIYDKEESKNINLSYHRNLICNLFINKILFTKDSEYIINKVNEYKKSDINVSEIILCLKNDIEINYKETINNVQDINKILIR